MGALPVRTLLVKSFGRSAVYLSTAVRSSSAALQEKTSARMRWELGPSWRAGGQQPARGHCNDGSRRSRCRRVRIDHKGRELRLHSKVRK